MTGKLHNNAFSVNIRQGAVEKERPGGEPVSRPGHEAAPLPQWRTAGAGR